MSPLAVSFVVVLVGQTEHTSAVRPTCEDKDEQEQE